MGKILIFRKMADVEIQSCLFDQHFTHIFGYKYETIVQKKKSCVHPEDNYIYEGGLTSFRPRHEDGSTRQSKLVNVVVHLLTVTH